MNLTQLKGQNLAVELLQRAIALNSDNVEAHFYLGNLYEDLQEFESAR